MNEIKAGEEEIQDAQAATVAGHGCWTQEIFLWKKEVVSAHSAPQGKWQFP